MVNKNMPKETDLKRYIYRHIRDIVHERLVSLREDRLTEIKNTTKKQVKK